MFAFRLLNPYNSPTHYAKGTSFSSDCFPHIISRSFHSISSILAPPGSAGRGFVRWFFSSFPHGTFSYQALKYISSLKVVPPIVNFYSLRFCHFYSFIRDHSPVSSNFEPRGRRPRGAKSDIVLFSKGGRKRPRALIDFARRYFQSLC